MLTPQQQRQASQEINDKLDNVQLSWNTEMVKWHPIAMKALLSTSTLDMQVPAKQYRKLINKEALGLNANVVAVLCNAVESKTPNQLEMTIEDYANALELNQQIADNWEALCAPIREKVLKQFESKIINTPAKIIQTVNTPSN